MMTNKKQMLMQLAFVVLMASAASYAFQHTQTAYQINGLCFYRYFAYASTAFLGYVCLSHYKKYLALAFSFTFSGVALSPFGQQAIELFPYVVPLFATLLGVTAVLIVPSSKGRGFFELLALLILPAVLAESRIGGSSRLLATTESIGYFELSVVAALVVGGYFYLRYATLTNLRCGELLSNGGNERDIARLNTWINSMIVLIVIGALGIASILMVAGPAFAGILQATAFAQPLNVLILATCAAVAIIAVLSTISHTPNQPR